jgi:hypothetical protein
MLTAYTREIDDVEISVAEILEQLDLRNQALENSVGILSFHPEFLDSGVVAAIAKTLPFDTIGGTSSNVSAGGALGGLMLVVTVLTSDDVAFRAGASLPITGDPEGPLRELYSRLASPEMGTPSLLFVYGPVIDQVNGDDYVRLLDAVSGGVPLFGSLATTNSLNLFGIETFANGERHTDALTLIAFFGETRPEFYQVGIPDEKATRRKATITEAVNNRIQKINGMVPLDYLESVGLAENGDISGIGSFPFVLTLDDGSQVARSIYKTTEEGEILSFGAAPKGAEVVFSDCDAECVVQSAKGMMARISTSHRTGSVLIFSCAGRRWTLGVTTESEMEEIAHALSAAFAYQFAYSSGEICPVKNRDGRLVNRFHNFSLVACVL